MGATQDNRSCLRRHRWKISLLVLIVVAAAVVVPLVIVKPWDKNKSNNSTNNSNSNSNNNNNTNPPPPVNPSQPIIPSHNDTAKANAYTPALDQPFDYQGGSVKMRGVNLGGWLVLEPFITPSLFDPYIPNGVVDEWTLCQHLGLDAATKLLDNHYNTWVTEDTFIRIRDLGLNHVRVPIGFWAMGNLVAGEPYVPNLSWKYLVRAIEWARKYGIRVQVELHGAPGSQNGWNHSGRLGAVNWINGTDGATNALRTLPYLQQMSTFFASPDYAHVDPIMGMLNEPNAQVIGGDKVKAWYQQALGVVRTAGGGTGKGPWAVIHDGFLGLSTWAGFLPGADRLMLDTHSYIMFDDGLIRMNQTAQLEFACKTWGSDITTSTKAFGPTMVGEFSVAVNDCAKYLNGIGLGYRWDGTFGGGKPVSPNATCVGANDPTTYTAEYKQFMLNFFNAQVDAWEQGAGWFYWNFKTESNPLWSYFDGVDGGWIPKDVNNRGPSFCAANGYPVNVVNSD
ncbi:glucan 1,3-beta-glucosidase [Entomortierella parvispora]|uniref:glucan 1,3-beta-glucosidase n=1 Tax=Entomortierella parvispora TaxID=205924 RepID=A0A9P3LRY8_9FUNG|nr:glucan 1,3-beta-glucosidase [Entomortierella parvispora]